MAILTSAQVRALDAPGKYGDGRGLYLRVRPTGARQWIYLFSLRKRRREMVLGAHPSMTLAEARRAADEARNLVADGIDPIDQRAEGRSSGEPAKSSAPTFSKAAEEYIAAMEATWRNPKSPAQWRMTIDVYAAPIAAIPVDELTVENVLSCLRPIWSTKAETATRVRGRIERIIDYSTAMGWRQGDNPAVWRGRLAMVLPKPAKLLRGHHAALPYKDVPAFYAHLASVEGSAARALAFLILTAARSGEVRHMEWGEIDWETCVWTVPAERMKASRPHRVPLSAPAMAILEGQRRLSRPFPGARMQPLSDMTMTQLLRRRFKDGQRFTVHGFRSSFRDWAGDETDHAREVIEAALAHAVGDAAERAYRRGDALAKRRALMDQWAAFSAG